MFTRAIDICIVIVLLVGSCSPFSANAEQHFPGKAQMGIDGSGKVLGIWHTVDLKTSQSMIQGVWGNSFPVNAVNITDPEKYIVREPQLATSTDSKATTKAAAVWIAKDLATENFVIQGTVLTSLGWKTPAVILSLNDKSEQPRNDYQVNISYDGRTIMITWSSFMQSLNDIVLRCALSTNGGLTWNSPVNMIALER